MPLTVGVCGLLLLPLASLLDRRSLIALGGVLILLGAGWGTSSRSTPQAAPESQGLVGLAAGLLLWVAAATQSGADRPIRSFSAADLALTPAAASRAEA